MGERRFFGGVWGCAFHPFGGSMPGFQTLPRPRQLLPTAPRAPSHAPAFSQFPSVMCPSHPRSFPGVVGVVGVVAVDSFLGDEGGHGGQSGRE